jgi:undecaprenyl-diphosphatase
MQSLFEMEWDRTVLRYINTRHNPFLDWLLPFLRNSEIWYPLYLFLILFVLINYKKTGWWWVVLAALTPALGDYISSGIIKENIFRLRPVNEPAVAGWLRMLPGLGLPQSSSFTSSHAANHFAMAVFLFLTLKKTMGRWVWLFFVWAAAICYAQVYVGVHYPFDIICGAAVGSLIGYTTGRIFNKGRGLQ